jgi:hypothetical protein
MLPVLIMFAPLILCLLLLVFMYVDTRWLIPFRMKKIRRDYLAETDKRIAIQRQEDYDAEEQELQELIYDIKANDYEIIYVFKELQ